MRTLVLLTCLAMAAARPLGAQDAAAEYDSPDSVSNVADSVPEDAFHDPAARDLFMRARQRRSELDESLLAYEAVVTERLAAGIRAFRRDRTLYRKESATRVRWSRDGTNVVQIMGAREEHPGGVEAPTGLSGFSVDDLWEPGADPLLFGSVVSEADDEDHEGFVHPLGPTAPAFYRYQTGDTLTLRLPDGRSLRAVELRFIPRERDFRRLSGSAWLEAGSGHLVRAVFTLAKIFDLEEDLETLREMDDDPDLEEGMGKIPGVLLPIQFELKAVVVDYGLWDFEYWMPRLLRADGVVRAGILQAPASFEVTYRILDTVTEEDVEEGIDRVPPAAEVLAGWGVEGSFRGFRRQSGGRTSEVILPEDEELLLTSPELPPPIWEETGASLTQGELKGFYERLQEVVDQAPRESRPYSFHWGHQRPDLIRYNKVEALSVGARAGTRLAGWDASLTARIAVADPEPDARLRLSRDGVSRAWELSAYHGLASVDPDQRSLTLGHSLNTLLLGRDDGEYYRRTGASVDLLPPASERRWSRVRVYAERQRAVERETHFSLPRIWDGDRVLSTNVAADEIDQVGALVRLRPWWGRGLREVKGGADLLVQAETGDMEFVRTSLSLSMTAPLVGSLRAGLEAAGGTAWGDVPVQRLWYLGGATTLRGYDGSAAVGESFLRGRAELAWWRPWGAVSVFGDVGWAGDRSTFRRDDGLASAGLGFSTLDGLLRIDLARALRHGPQWRLELYLDGLL